MKLIFAFSRKVASWPSGQDASRAAPGPGTNPARSHPRSHPTMANVKCRERASVFCIKCKSEFYKQLTHKEKLVMNHGFSVHNKRPSNIITQTKWHLMKSKLQVCFDVLIPNMRTPTRGIYTIRTKNSLSMRSVCKKLHHVRIMKLYSCMIHKREVEQIFTCFSLHHISVPYHIQMITTNSNDLMNFH